MSWIIVSTAQQPKLAYQKHSGEISSSKIIGAFKFGAIEISSRALPFSGHKFQLSLTRDRPFSRECNCKERFELFAFSGSNWIRVDAKRDDCCENGDEFVVVNFYRFVLIEDPEEEVCKHLSFMQGRDICGRIYLNEQGINAQYSGPSKDALAYVKWVREDHRFSDILVQISASPKGHVFPRLKLRCKPSLVQLEGGISHLPLLDPSIRAIPLAPAEWRNRLEADNNIGGQSDVDLYRNCILLDVRNGYEWDIGHFQGAQRPDVDCFRSTSYGLAESEVTESDPLATVDKEKTDILMYCTGGIRCDVYSAILRQQGFKKLYTLKGGISNYLKTEGSSGWVGNLFVFDARLALPPSTFKHEANAENQNQEASQDNSFGNCYICGSHVSELRHRNCANLDCNLLFLCCMGCVNQLKGCCCLKCTSASRLRPALPGHLRYKKWHHYRDFELERR